LKAAEVVSPPLAALGLLGFAGSISFLMAELDSRVLKMGPDRVGPVAGIAPAAGCRGIAAWAVSRKTARMAAMKVRDAMMPRCWCQS